MGVYIEVAGNVRMVARLKPHKKTRQEIENYSNYQRNAHNIIWNGAKTMWNWNAIVIAIALMASLGFGYWLGLNDGVKKERKEAYEWNEKIKREEAIERSKK